MKSNREVCKGPGAGRFDSWTTYLTETQKHVINFSAKKVLHNLGELSLESSTSSKKDLLRKKFAERTEYSRSSKINKLNKNVA